MSRRKVAIVFGATGNQGGSVARAFARTGEYMVRGVTRDMQSQRARDLMRDGVDVVNYDLNDRSGLQLILHKADVCFVNTATDFDDPNCLDKEIAQGCLIADYCLSEGVKHVIFSAQLNSYQACSIMARHLVAKSEIAQYMRSLHLPLTCLIMPVYYEDFMDIFRPTTTDGRNYSVEIPMGTTPLDMISVEDVGPVVVAASRNFDYFVDKTLSVCGDKLTTREIAHILSTHLRPKVFKDKQITTYEWEGKRQADLKGCTDWANMFQFFQRVDQRYNLSVTQEMNPELRRFEQWVYQNASTISAAIDRAGTSQTLTH